MPRKKEGNPRGVFEKKPGSGIWWIQYFDQDGKRHRERAGRKSTAIDLYYRRRADISEGKKLPKLRAASSASFDELAADALEYSKAHKESYEDDVIRMSKILERFGGHAAASLNAQDFDRWLSGLKRTVNGEAQPLKNATLNRYRSLLSLTFRLGVENEKIIVNPIKRVKRRKENNERVRFLLPEEEVRLRGVLEEHYPHRIPEFDLALNTGMRQSEQYHWISKETINFDNRVLTVPKTKYGPARHIPLNDTAIGALQQIVKHGQGNEALFLNRYGEKLSKPREWFERALKLANIANFRWHDLRHTFASMLVMAGVDLRTVQELMGHRTIQMTIRYAHLAPTHTLAAVQRLCDTNLVQSAGATTSATGAYERSSVVQ